MAIQMGSGFTIGSSEPIDSRLVMSKDQMLNINPLTQPEKYFCVCSDDSLIYVYDANNADDPATGKFRVVSVRTSFSFPATSGLFNFLITNSFNAPGIVLSSVVKVSSVIF